MVKVGAMVCSVLKKPALVTSGRPTPHPVPDQHVVGDQRDDKVQMLSAPSGPFRALLEKEESI